MAHKFFEVRQNSNSIVTIFVVVMSYYSQRKIIGLDQSFPEVQTDLTQVQLFQAC